MATEKRVKENLVLICKRLTPEAFLMGVASVLHPADVEISRKKIERGFSTDSMLVNDILDCLKRRPRWVETFVAFLRQNDEIEILNKLGEQVPEQKILQRDTNNFPHSTAPAFTVPRGPGHPQQHTLLGPSCAHDVAKQREATPGVWRGIHSNLPVWGYAGTSPAYSYNGVVQGNADFETKNYQYPITENASVNEHKIDKSSECDVTLQDVVNNMGLKKSQTYPGLVSRQASFVTPQQSEYHHSVSYGQLGFTTPMSPPDENQYGKAHEREPNGCTINNEMIGGNLASAEQDIISTVQQTAYQSQPQRVTCRDQRNILLQIQHGQNNVLYPESKCITVNRSPGFYTPSNLDHEPVRQSLNRNRHAGEGNNNAASRHSMRGPHVPQQQRGHGHVTDSDYPDQDNSRLPPFPNQSAQRNDIPATPCPISLSNFQSIATGPGRPQGINDLSETTSNTENIHNSLQLPVVPVNFEEERTLLLQPGHRNVTEDMSLGTVTEYRSQENVTEDLSLRHFSREEGDNPGLLGLQDSTPGPSLQVDSGSSGDVCTHGVVDSGSSGDVCTHGFASAHGVDSSRGAQHLPLCPPSERACGRHPPDHYSSGGAYDALPSLQNEARSDFPNPAKSHSLDLEIDQPGEISNGGSGARENRSREDLDRSTSNQLCPGFVTAEPYNGEDNGRCRKSADCPGRSEPSVTSSPAVDVAPSSACPPPSPSRELQRQPSNPVNNIYIKNLIMNNDSSFNLASDVIANTVLGNNAPASPGSGTSCLGRSGTSCPGRSGTSCPGRNPDVENKSRPERDFPSSSQQQQLDFALQDHRQLQQTQVKCQLCDAGQQDVPAEMLQSTQSTQARARPTDRSFCHTTQGSPAGAYPGTRREVVAPLLMPSHTPDPGRSPGDDARPRAADQNSVAEQHRPLLNTHPLSQHLPLCREKSELSGFELRQIDHHTQHADTACLRSEENTILKVPQERCPAQSACQGREGETVDGQGHQCQGCKVNNVLCLGRWNRSSTRPSIDTQNNRGSGQRTTTTTEVPTQCHPDLRLEKCPAVAECRQPLVTSHQVTRLIPGTDLAPLCAHARPASNGHTGLVQMHPCCRHGNAPDAPKAQHPEAQHPEAQHPEAFLGLERGQTVPSPCDPSKASGRESDSGVGGCRAEGGSAGGENLLSIPGYLRLDNVPPHSFHLQDLNSPQCLSQSLEFHPDILLRLHSETAKANILGQSKATLIVQQQEQTNIFHQMQTELTEANMPKLSMLLA